MVERGLRDCPPPAGARGDDAAPGARSLPLLAAGAGTVLAVLLARAALDGRIVYPGCGFRWLTGHPCPACGGTHALAALARADVSASVAHNPLVALAALALLVLALLAGLDLLARRGAFTTRLGPRAAGALRRHRAWLLVALALNWFYLWHRAG